MAGGAAEDEAEGRRNAAAVEPLARARRKPQAYGHGVGQAEREEDAVTTNVLQRSVVELTDRERAAAVMPAWRGFE